MMGQTDTGIILRDFSGKRKCKPDLVDRISLLPDSILGVILSFLSTKEAVATVLLSKRWDFLWTTVHNLEFCQEPNSCSEENDNKFIEFVNRVLHMHDAGLLNKFSVICDCHHVLSHTNSWINTAITKNAHNLSLHAYLSELTWDLYVYDLGASDFRCDSLRSLELSGMNVCFSDTHVFCLPRLESLKLVQVIFKSKEAFEKLINGCPILNCLNLYIANGDWIDFKCRISSASLRRLDLYFNQKISLKLNAALLEYLVLGGRIREIIIETSLSSLVEADLDVSFDVDDDDDDDDDEQEGEEGISYNSIVEAIRGFAGSAKVLTLSSNIITALERATTSLSITFKRLVELHITPCGSLQYFIRSSDNLEVLHIFEQSGDRPSKWISFAEVPRCFSNNLRKVEICLVTYGEDDLEIIRLILEHGSRLEVVEIRCWGWIGNEDTGINVDLLRERFNLAQKILDFPRKSPACRVRISDR